MDFVRNNSDHDLLWNEAAGSGTVFVLVLHFVLCDVSLHRYFLGNCFHSGRSTFGCGHGTGNSCRDDCRRHCGWSVFGDKMSPLSDSTVLAASCSRVDLLDHVKHMFYSTVPALAISLVLFFVLGFQFKGGTISGEEYNAILSGLDASFNLNLLTLLPPIVVLALVLMKKPAIPTFGAGIVVAFIIGIVTQGADPVGMLNAMSKGVSMETGVPIVNTLVNRGGIVSMLDTIGLMLSAAILRLQ